MYLRVSVAEAGRGRVRSKHVTLHVQAHFAKHAAWNPEVET
jgi:hypothetical protein